MNSFHSLLKWQLRGLKLSLVVPVFTGLLFGPLELTLLNVPAYANLGLKFKSSHPSGNQPPKLKHPIQKFLPPVATINPAQVLNPAASALDLPETVTLNDSSNPSTSLKKQQLQLTHPEKALPGSVSILQVKNPGTDPSGTSTINKLQQALEEKELQVLWQAAVERNPVIRFSLEKLAIPKDLQGRHSSQFMNKTLNVLISGATMAAVMVPGGGAYRNMSSMAGGDALRNVLVNKGQGATPAQTLSPTELIQLASLVDELKGTLIHTYHDYRNNLAALAEAHNEALRQNQIYTKAMQSGNSLATLASATAYYRATMVETDLRQRAKLNRVQLERLAGIPAINHLQLALAPELPGLVNKPGDKDKAEPPTQTVHAVPLLPKPMPKAALKVPEKQPDKNDAKKEPRNDTDKQALQTETHGLQKANELIGPASPFLPNLENGPSSPDPTTAGEEDRQLTPASALESRVLPVKAAKPRAAKLAAKPQPVKPVISVNSKPDIPSAKNLSTQFIGPSVPPHNASSAPIQIVSSAPTTRKLSTTSFVGPPIPSSLSASYPPTVAQLMGKTPDKRSKTSSQVTRALPGDPAKLSTVSNKTTVPLPPGPPPSSQTAAETLILN